MKEFFVRHRHGECIFCIRATLLNNCTNKHNTVHENKLTKLCYVWGKNSVYEIVIGFFSFFY